jgi:hypothetical protein
MKNQSPKKNSSEENNFSFTEHVRYKNPRAMLGHCLTNVPDCFQMLLNYVKRCSTCSALNKYFKKHVRSLYSLYS